MWERSNIFTLLDLPMDENSMSHHLFRSSLIYFISIMSLSLYKSCIRFVRSTFKYFKFLVIIHFIAFKISMSMCSLLVYRNTIRSFMFIFYPVTLLNLLICSWSFFIVVVCFVFFGGGIL